MEYILNNAILALLDSPDSTLLGITRILVDKDYRQRVVNNLKDPVVKAFWVNEYEEWQDKFRNEAIAPIQNKVGQFLSTAIVRNVVGQAKSTIDIFDLMNQGKIFLINVSKGRIGEDNSALLGAMLITKIQLASMERVRVPEDERKDFYLYVDEFQNFATDSFASVLSEARKYRLNLIIAHQYVGQLVTDVSTKVRDAVFGNAGTMIVFRVGAADAEFLEPEFEPEFMIPDIVNLPNYRIYVKLMVNGMTSRPFSAKTLPPFKTNTEAAGEQTIIAMSRTRYARPREVVEKEINRWAGGSGMETAEEEKGEASSPVVARSNVDSTGHSILGAGSSAGVTKSGDYFISACSACGKEAKLPFKPTPGRPVYCSECLEKVKAGTIKPVKMMKKPPAEKQNQAQGVLSKMGIEFLSSFPPSPQRDAVAKKPASIATDSDQSGILLRDLKTSEPVRHVVSQPNHPKQEGGNASEAAKIKEALAKTLRKDTP